MLDDYVDIDSALLTCKEPTVEHKSITANKQHQSEEIDKESISNAEQALKVAGLLSRLVNSNIEKDNMIKSFLLLSMTYLSFPFDVIISGCYFVNTFDSAFFRLLMAGLVIP